MIEALDPTNGQMSTNGSVDSAAEAGPSLEALLFDSGAISADELGELVRDSVLTKRPVAALAVERGLTTVEALAALQAGAGEPVDATPVPTPVPVLPVLEIASPVEPLVPAEPLHLVTPVIEAVAAPVPEPVQVTPVIEAVAPVIEAVAPVIDVVAAPVPEPVQAVPVAPAIEALAPPVPAPVIEAVAPVAAPAAPEFEVVVPLPKLAPPGPLDARVQAAVASAANGLAPTTPAPEPEAVAEPEPVAFTPEVTAPAGFSILVRMQTGERIAVDTATTFEHATELARSLAARFSGVGEWPLLAGRLLRPEAVVSIDIERALDS